MRTALSKIMNVIDRFFTVSSKKSGVYLVGLTRGRYKITVPTDICNKLLSKRDAQYIGACRHILRHKLVDKDTLGSLEIMVLDLIAKYTKESSELSKKVALGIGQICAAAFKNIKVSVVSIDDTTRKTKLRFTNKKMSCDMTFYEVLMSRDQREVREFVFGQLAKKKKDYPVTLDKTAPGIKKSLSGYKKQAGILAGLGNFRMTRSFGR